MIENSSSQNKKDIIFLTDNYHSLGGVQRSTTTIANELHTRGHTVKIMSISPGVIPMSHKLNSGIPVITCNPKIPPRQKFANTSVGRKIREPLTKVFNFWKPQKLQFEPPLKEGVNKLAGELRCHGEKSIIVVTNVLAMHYLNQALEMNSESRRPKIIGQYKGDFSKMPRSNVKRLVTTYASADLLLGLTEEDAAQLERVAKTPVSHIANPIPSASDSYLDEPKEKCFLALGRLAKDKSHTSLIRAWKPIAEKFPDWKLIIFGEGPLRKDLEKLVKREGLESHISLPGKTEDPSLVLARARANVVTSKHEGFGLTISEAAAVGTPTIAFNTSPGIRLQLRHEKNGLLVPPQDISGLTAAIERLICDQPLYETLRANALIHVRRFDVEEIINRWEKLFDSVVT